jgi:hypothetical protein
MRPGVVEGRIKPCLGYYALELPSTGEVALGDRGGAERGNWRSFEEAREFVRTLGLKGQEEWKLYYRSGQKPHDIPSTPWMVYGNIWKRM